MTIDISDNGISFFGYHIERDGGNLLTEVDSVSDYYIKNGEYEVKVIWF